jgi:hypothetical protein
MRIQLCLALGRVFGQRPCVIVASQVFRPPKCQARPRREITGVVSLDPATLPGSFLYASASASTKAGI